MKVSVTGDLRGFWLLSDVPSGVHISTFLNVCNRSDVSLVSVLQQWHSLLKYIVSELKSEYVSSMFCNLYRLYEKHEKVDHNSCFSGFIKYRVKRCWIQIKVTPFRILFREKKSTQLILFQFTAMHYFVLVSNLKSQRNALKCVFETWENIEKSKCYEYLCKAIERCGDKIVGIKQNLNDIITLQAES